MAAPQYLRTIEGWHLVGNHAGAMPIASQSDAWDLLPDSEWERLGALFEAAIPDDDDAYDVWAIA